MRRRRLQVWVRGVLPLCVILVSAQLEPNKVLSPLGPSFNDYITCMRHFIIQSSDISRERIYSPMFLVFKVIHKYINRTPFSPPWWSLALYQENSIVLSTSEVFPFAICFLFARLFIDVLFFFLYFIYSFIWGTTSSLSIYINSPITLVSPFTFSSFFSAAILPLPLPPFFLFVLSSSFPPLLLYFIFSSVFSFSSSFFVFFLTTVFVFIAHHACPYQEFSAWWDLCCDTLSWSHETIMKMK